MYILTVSEIDAYLRELLSSDPILSDIWVEGEISNFRRVSSGHCYFSLKESDAVLDAVMWRSAADRLVALPSNGDAVLTHGYVSFYAPNGRLQLYVDTIQAAGVGQLYARFQALQTLLAAEGLFDPTRKRSLPPLPRRVGLVTSSQAAALQDILTVITRRCPMTEVVLSPCLVQGEQAAQSIVAALQSLYQTDIDVIIVARGGGSIEDLWVFNEEVVARALFASPVPLVTGIGHETDTTIADYVADVRAPTPSAAAELVVPDQSELHRALERSRQQLTMALQQQIATQRYQVDVASAGLQRYNPARLVAHARQDVDDQLRRATHSVAHALSLRQVRMQSLESRLTTLSPRATLARGYAVIRRSADGSVVSQASQLAPDDTLDITLTSGRVIADVVTIELDA